MAAELFSETARILTHERLVDIHVLETQGLSIRAFKDAAKHIKMVDDLIHRQHQTMRHLQRSIDSIDYKSRLIKRMDLELAALESKQSVKGVLPLDDKSS
jgi:hypothetical protein